VTVFFVGLPYASIMATTQSDPVEFVDSLNVEQLRAKLTELDRQMAATKLLLRAALARRREEIRQRPGRKEGGVGHD
jgi:hypothetical protein